MTVEDLLAAASGNDLTEVEAGAIRDVYDGRPAPLAEGQSIRAAVLRRLLLNADLVRDGQPGRICVSGGEVTGTLSLVGLSLDFGLRFENVQLGELVLTDSRLLALEFVGGRAQGITADRLEVAHDMVLNDGFTNHGRVYLPSASIGGDLNCGGASLQAPDGQPSLLFDGARIGGRVFLRASGDHGFHANHGVHGWNARIGGGILMTKGRFDREVNFTRAQVQGQLVLTEAEIGGKLVLRGMHIASDAIFEETKYSGPKIVLARARIDGTLTWAVIRPEEAGSYVVDLLQAQVRYLDDNLDCWKRSKVRLDGFSFDGITARGKSYSLAKRKAWLARQPDGDWSAYPYDQVRAALRDAGQEAAARDIAVEREEMRREKGDLGKAGWLANWAYGLLLGHGYKPLNFFIASAILVTAFAVYFALAFDACEPGASVQQCGDFVLPKVDAPDFRAGLYSIDAFVPVDLKQVAAWTPSGSFNTVVLTLEIALGWLFAGLLVGAVTGILRRD